MTKFELELTKISQLAAQSHPCVMEEKAAKGPSRNIYTFHL